MPIVPINNFKEMPPEYRKAVYIVSDIKEYNVEMTHFNELLKLGRKNAHAVSFKNLLKQNLIGTDGIEVDFSLGALVQVIIGPTKTGGGFTVHMANVGPSNESGYIQYSWAKTILGVEHTERPDGKWLEMDGQFRERGIKEVS